MSALTVTLGGERLRLSDADLLGEGGEGRVYRAGDLAVKILHAPDAARQAKLRAFPRALPARVVAPLDVCLDPKGAVVGFSMRALDGAVDAVRLAQRRWREPRVRNAELCRIFRELTGTIAQLHARGVVVGDLNDGNVALTAPAGSSPASGGFSPWLIDADSMQFGAFPCVVAHERFLDPRMYGKDLRAGILSRESDWYALAVLFFSSLLYVHPFGGAHPSYPTLLRRAEARHSVLRADVKLPPSAARPDVLDDDALAFFERVFEKDLRAPLPASLLEARFATCSCGVEHARRSCPRCAARVHVAPKVRARGRLRAVRVFDAARGRVVCASADGAFAFVYEKDGALFREDGRRVLPASGDADGAIARAYARDPARTVRVAGRATWVGCGGRVTRIEAEHVAESVPVGLVQGEIAADAGVGGLVHAEGDVLVRAADGTRIGRVLEGQTRVRVGATLGFAFYRAGGLTLAFVFDVRRGPLRQVALPHLSGKLVDWSAVFDEAHVLVTFATESDGRLEHAAHLVDARGELVASERGAPGTSAILAGTAGRCVHGGSVLAATSEGLVLVRADRRARAFAPARLFAEAKDLVSPEDDLFVGPGGSIHVVTHDEIFDLTFSESPS